MNQHSGSATLPRGFRFSGYEAPRTPEPSTSLQNEEPEVEAPARPRLKLKKRRVVSNFAAPTQQFLASVAAADVPVPSIEEPEADPADFDMMGVRAFPEHLHEEEQDTILLRPRGRTFSPPKTPAPDFVPSLSPRRYPNWTIDSAISSVESTPEYESSRPSTSRSTQTNESLFSRFSHYTDDDHSSSVDGKEKYTLFPDEDAGHLENAGLKGHSRKAPWTKAMSDHLWSTFVLYLQDPKVTPVRMGKSGIPPHGVCLRVAREAKRSWKGSKALAKAANPDQGRKSGSSTPTAVEGSGTFMQWPHTCAATRAHMRELCKLKAASGANHRFMSRSTTPFSQVAARHWNRRSTPARTASVFTTQDMSMSLALSTADSMQPQGPLAQLTRSAVEPTEEFPPMPPFPAQTLGTFEGEPSFAERRRLGSPFGAKSYGPSSSGSLASAFGFSGPMPRRQTHTVGPRRTLQSPVRLSRSGTQKRRNTQCSEPRKRPSIGGDLFDPKMPIPSIEVSWNAEFSSTNSQFIPRAQAEPFLPCSTSMPDVASQLAAPELPPPRLGSPFSASGSGSVSTTNSSFSFPNRVHRSYGSGSVDLGMLGRPFATFQHDGEFTANQSRPNLAGRLAYIDQRLKELRRRDVVRRRSESPL
ncbi:hypothetical protein B0T19DRAFT_65944 [Cercophora scortea]|uniref:Uncharacterized protein n=1 Tax=Cercophora scortea TaxID=314031 RepID=A0AAE0J5B1_9PEZI|nr:hypothetical protein B0T19DRAFT_65944 [Cercophora scortea]